MLSLVAILIKYVVSVPEQNLRRAADLQVRNERCRKANLKFAQDDLGMFKNKYISRFTDLLFRMSRTEATVSVP